MFGSSSLYVLHHPKELEINKKNGVHLEEITYDLAQEEIAANSGFDMAKGTGHTKSESYRALFETVKNHIFLAKDLTCYVHFMLGGFIDGIFVLVWRVGCISDC